MEKIFTPVPNELLSAIKSCKRAVVCGHLNPDGDCANSVIAMGLILKTLGKDCILVNDGSFDRPEISFFEERLSKDVPDSWKNCETLGVVVDCGTSDRLGNYKTLFDNFTVIVIDHHSSGKPFGCCSYIIPKSPSTTLLIFKIAKALDIGITEEFAKHVFKGFATDSGFFKFLGKGTEECFEIIAELVRCGVVPSEEYILMTSGKPFGFAKNLAKLIDRTEQFFDCRVMLSHEEESDSIEFGKDSKASDEYYAQMLSIKNVQVVVLIKISTKEDGALEVGFRASNSSSVSIDVGAIAAKHGGGGHSKASGVTIKGKYSDIKKMILEDLEKYFR